MDEVTKTKAQLVAEVTHLRTHASEHEAVANRERQLRECLQASEVRYRRLFEAAQDGILILDAQSGEIVAVNPFLANLLGYPQHEMVGQKLWDIGPFRDVFRSRIAFKELQDKAYIRYEDLPLETAAGRAIAVEFVSNVYLVDRTRVIQCNIRDISDRKRAEAQVRLQSVALEAAANAMVITNRDGLIEWVNPAFSELTGYGAAEALGRNPRDLGKSGRQDPAFYEQLWKTIVSGQVWRGELINRRKDGSAYVEEQVITPVRDAAGVIRHFIAIKQDVTERKRAESDARARAQLLSLRGAVDVALSMNDSLATALQQCAEALIEHLAVAAAGIWTLEDDAGVLELQGSAGLMTEADGPPGRALIGVSGIGRIAQEGTPYATDAAIGDPRVDDQAWVSQHGLATFAAQPLVAGGRVVGVLALLDGQPLPASVLNTLAFVADHIAAGIDRHRVMETIRVTEERTRFALQSAEVGIWDHNFTTNVANWSAVREAHSGLAQGTFGGTLGAFAGTLHPDDRAAVIAAFTGAKTAGSAFISEYRTQWPDGTIRRLQSFGRFVLDERGEPTRGSGVTLDVTERRALEAQLQQAQKMEAVGRLAGGVAHDFNNLLTVILGFSELLLADLGPGDPHRINVAEIQKAGTMAASLTHQLLAFSRQELVAPKVLDLNVVVGELRPMLERLISEDVEVILRLSSTAAMVNADRAQLEQVVMNLAVNARDAMAKGGRLTIATRHVDLDDGYATTHVGVIPGPRVALTVTDTGTGMAPEVQAHLFEPFFTTKAKGHGTGLGLATVHGIVKQSGGSIGVYSELGLGTSFTVYLPPADAEAIVAEALPTVEPPRPHGPRTVLVVDDAESVRELTGRVLQHQGYTVLLAANADEARRRFDEHPDIDVLLTDVVMPGASGPEFVKDITTRRPDLRVVYMSGYTDDAIFARGLSEPGVVLLNKPFTGEAPGRAIRGALGE